MLTVQRTNASKKVQTPHPVVIGLQGFTSPEECCRSEEILGALSEFGICGINVKYSGIKKVGEVITCDFNLERGTLDLQEAFEAIRLDPNADPNNIGVFTSSVGASVFACHQARRLNPEVKISCYVGVSPLLGWPYFATQETRDLLQRPPLVDLDITTAQDTSRGIKRILTSGALESVIRTDGLGELEKSGVEPGMKVLTFLGMREKVATPDSVRRYHALLGGKPADLIEYDCGHAIPNEVSRQRIIDFFYAQLTKPSNQLST